MKRISINDLFKFRGQILLTEKIKGMEENCQCGLCHPPKRGVLTWYDATINPVHYDSIKLFVPMSKTKFKTLVKEYENSFIKKDVYEKTLKLEKQLRNGLFKAKTTKRCRLYPLHKSVYDKFADYIYEKFGKPKFKKRNIHGVNWGESQKIEYASRRYGVWTHTRTVGIQLYQSGFEFYVDNLVFRLANITKNEWRRKNPKKFPKKLGKLV